MCMNRNSDYFNINYYLKNQLNVAVTGDLKGTSPRKITGVQGSTDTHPQCAICKHCDVQSEESAQCCTVESEFLPTRP